MRILITGSNGRLGSCLVALLTPQHAVTGIDRVDFDLAAPDATGKLVALHPELVIHAAAWTDVDACARDPEEALRINAYGTKQVALACHHLGVPLLHVSTNEVFDGRQSTPYLEYDEANPINPYGYSKWVAEQIVRELVPQHYIVRLSWLIAHGGNNFVHAILKRAQAGQPLRVVTDEIGIPTYNDDLAQAIADLAQTGQYGTYHLVNGGEATSRWGLARFILDHAGFAETPIDHIVLADYERPSTVPPYTVLRNSAAAHLGITLRPWQDAVCDFLRKEGLYVQP